MGSLVKPAADRGEAIERLRAVEPHAVNGESAEAMAEGGALLDIIESGRPVGAASVHIEGDSAYITAFASEGQDTYRELALIEAALKRAGVRRLCMLTKRQALVRNLVREGYTLKLAELEKAL